MGARFEVIVIRVRRVLDVRMIQQIDCFKTKPSHFDIQQCVGS